MKRSGEIFDGPLPIAFILHQVGQPKRQAVDETCSLAIRAVKCADKIKWLLKGLPFRAAPGTMFGDAIRQFRISGTAGGNVNRGSVPRGPAFGKPALSRTRAARNEYRQSHGGMTLQKSVVKKSERASCFPPPIWS